MKKIAINFMMIGTRYAFRHMDYIPREGESVMLKTPKGTAKSFLVSKVTHEISEDNENHWQVYIFIKDPDQQEK